MKMEIKDEKIICDICKSKIYDDVDNQDCSDIKIFNIYYCDFKIDKRGVPKSFDDICESCSIKIRDFLKTLY